MKIQHVTDYHREREAAGSNMVFMAFRDEDTGERIERGWVVSGFKGRDSYKLFPTKAEAMLFVDHETLKDYRG